MVPVVISVIVLQLAQVSHYHFIKCIIEFFLCIVIRCIITLFDVILMCQKLGVDIIQYVFSIIYQLILSVIIQSHVLSHHEVIVEVSVGVFWRTHCHFGKGQLVNRLCFCGCSHWTLIPTLK